MGFYRGPNIVTDGLVFAVDAGSERSYPGSGTTTTNIINGASGTLTNGVGYVSNNGGAFDFDGTDDFILFPDDTNLNLQTLTMESWSYLNTTIQQNGFLFEKGLVNTQYSNFFEGTSFIFRTMGLSTSSFNIASSLFSANSWNHIVCTYTSGTKRITGTETVANVAIATYTAAFFDFVIKKTTNVRSGTVYACHDGTNVEFTETSTQDLGDTSDVTLSVDISGTDMRLRATTTSDDWSVKSLIRAI